MTSCPDWFDDAAERKTPEFSNRVYSALVHARTNSMSSIPENADIMSWHKQIFMGIAPLEIYAGNYRQDTPKEPCLAVNVSVGNVPGASYTIVPTVMVNFFNDLGREMKSLELQWTEISAVEKLRRVSSLVAVAVGEFIRIHPFVNGNGRMSRTLWNVLLHRMGFPAEVSVINRPDPPYNNLMKQAMQGNYAPLVVYLFDTIATTPPKTKIRKSI